MERFGKYTLIKRLAFGGMAEIFLARLEGAEGFRKTCVLKRILPQFSADADFVRMFVDEAVLAARFEHPNVAQTYDFGSVGGIYFIAMEFVDGPDLRRLIRESTRKARSFTLAECAMLGEEICRGLSYVHNLRDELGVHLAVVHRDISPHNIMVSQAGQAKIMDFGIAKAAMRAVKTQTGTIKGKLAYMAPEQANAENVDKRTDQFSVGLVLWEFITGARHFDANSEPELLGRVMRGEIRDVRELRPDTPAPLADIVSRMLQSSPQDRYSDLSDVEQALNEFRFSLGSAGAVRLANLVSTLTPPIDLTTPEGLSSSASVPVSTTSEKPLTRSISQAIEPSARSEVAPQWPTGKTVAGMTGTLQSDPSFNGVPAADPTKLLDGPPAKPTNSVSAPFFSRFRVLGLAAVAIAFFGVGIGVWLSGSKTSPPSTYERPVVANPVEEVVEETPAMAATDIGSGSEDGDLSRVKRKTKRSESKPKPKSKPEPPENSRNEAEVSYSTVHIDSRPHGATVVLNGRKLKGKTPLQISGRQRGQTLNISLSLRGYRRVSGSLTINKDKEFFSRKLPLAASPASTTARSDKLGRLSLNTLPTWVEVYLDGKKLGNTPLRGLRVPAGELTLRLKNDSNGIDQTLKLTVPENGHLKHNAKLSVQ